MGLNRQVCVARRPLDLPCGVVLWLWIEFDMSITKERKSELIQEYRRSDEDTGSPDVQIAVLTARITELTGHLKEHEQDHASRRGLLMLVSRRRRLLDFVRRKDPGRYVDLITRLKIRK